ncbi:MAG: WD40/YVTN/BNR-like repeat-containing protein [Cephaloticoccus sp.]
MKASLLALSLAVLTPAGLTAGAPVHDLYAAVAMTKAQKNSSTPSDSGLYVRPAGTMNWEHFGPRVLGITSVAFQPGSDGQVVLIASADGVVRSTDGGKTWRLTTGWEVIDVRAFAFNPGNANEVYAATAWGPLRSTDGGATWSLAQAGLYLLYGQTLVADAQTPGRVLLGTEDGIYQSTDGAKTWARTDSPPATALRMVQSATNPNLILAGTQGRGAWLSRDAGRSWSQTDAGSATANLYAASIDPHDADRLAVGGWGVGVRVSADGGASWEDRSAGLPVKNVFVLAFDSDVTGRLWVSTFEEGAFYSDDLGLTWQDGGLYGAYGFDFVFVPARR